MLLHPVFCLFTLTLPPSASLRNLRARKPPDTPPTRPQPSTHVRPSSPPPRQTTPPIDAGFLPSRVGRMSRTPSAAVHYNSPSSPTRSSRNHQRPSASSLSPIPTSMASPPTMGMETATVVRGRNPSNLFQQERRREGGGGSDGGAVDTARNTTTVTTNATTTTNANATTIPNLNAMETPSPLPPVSFFERVREAIVSHPYTTAILMRDFNDPHTRGHPRSGDQTIDSGLGTPGSGDDKPRPAIKGLQVALLISMPSQERSFTRRMKAKLEVDSYQHIEGDGAAAAAAEGEKGKRIDRGSSFDSRGSMEGEEYEGFLGEFVVGTTSVPWGKEVG
ncbi:hypothetical protein NLI96_g11410 [Meripilus lineatus]|uniref:Uncharacterized protein n=1 Tax=Meripilus lineatus TaxID=2056292 RepID=A0AAD5Y959_9APHY|nr:hypothetical protein NLI96_g11410 [Physisporinus lineatus]